MSNIVIKAENISKQYRLGEVGTGTLSHDLTRLWAKIRGKEDPFLRIGEENNRSVKGESDYVWSLRDINFEIEKGDAIGIIGRNGAGKSTLLKLLSKITKPTTGNIYLDGRVASLLEVGTGFQPMMTGRENIYLNGAILGMSRKEITKKFDEIVDFSGVERYIDTPVKRYSSGMYVRLAFAVAAHLESEILIIDEVLAVGDVEFQKKCLGKMGDISHNEGRTVLFVSHNMAAIKTLCNKGIVFEKGRLIEQGDINYAIDKYFSIRADIKGESNKEYKEGEGPGSNKVELMGYKLINDRNEPITSFNLYEDAYIEVVFRIKEETTKNDFFYPNLHFFDREGSCTLVSCASREQAVNGLGNYSARFHIPKYTFNSGIYEVGIAITVYPGTEVHFYLNPAMIFGITEEDLSFRKFPYTGPMPGLMCDTLPKNTMKL